MFVGRTPPSQLQSGYCLGLDLRGSWGRNLREREAKELYYEPGGKYSISFIFFAAAGRKRRGPRPLSGAIGTETQNSTSSSSSPMRGLEVEL